MDDESTYSSAVDPEQAKENFMLARIFEDIKAFYKVPANARAYRAWRKNKEVTDNDTDYINA
jgi:hypothetical protein